MTYAEELRAAADFQEAWLTNPDNHCAEREQFSNGIRLMRQTADSIELIKRIFTPACDAPPAAARCPMCNWSTATNDYGDGKK